MVWMDVWAHQQQFRASLANREVMGVRVRAWVWRCGWVGVSFWTRAARQQEQVGARRVWSVRERPQLYGTRLYLNRTILTCNADG